MFYLKRIGDGPGSHAAGSVDAYAPARISGSVER